VAVVVRCCSDDDCQRVAGVAGAAHVAVTRVRHLGARRSAHHPRATPSAARRHGAAAAAASAAGAAAAAAGDAAAAAVARVVRRPAAGVRPLRAVHGVAPADADSAARRRVGAT